MKSEIKFNIAQPAIIGFGINDLISKLFNINLYREELQLPEKILFNSQSKTIFKNAKGNISFKKSDGEGKIRTEISAPAINSILTGSINNDTNNIDLLFNSIFG